MSTTEPANKRRKKPTWQDHLKDDGVAVIPGVLDDAACTRRVDAMWAHATAVVPTLHREQSEPEKNVYAMHPFHGMLHKHHRWGNLAAVYDVRQNPSVTAEFSDIWGTNSLTSSVDGVAFGKFFF